MTTAITSETKATPLGTDAVQQNTVAVPLSTDPSDIKNGVNGFNLSKCSTPTEATAIIYMPNLGYGIPLNLLLANKAQYIESGEINGEPTFVPVIDESMSSYSFSRKDFSYSKQGTGESEKLIGRMLQVTDDNSVAISVERIFQPRNIGSKHYATSVTLNAACSKKYTLQQDIELPTPIFIRHVVSDVTKQPYPSLFELPASPFGVDTFAYVAGEEDNIREYGSDIITRHIRSAHMPIRRGEGVLSDIYHAMMSSGEYSTLGSPSSVAYCLLGHELIESMKTELIMKGDIESGDSIYVPPYSDLERMSAKTYSSYPSDIASTVSMCVIDGYDYDASGEISETFYAEHPINELYETYFDKTDDATTPDLLTQFIGGLGSGLQKDVLRFTSPAVFISSKTSTGAMRYYVNDEFTRDVLKTLVITGSSTPPVIKTAAFSQHMISEGLFSSDPLIEELGQAKIYKSAFPDKYDAAFLSSYDKYIELLKGIKASGFPEIVTFDDISVPELTWLYENNDLTREAFYTSTSIENFLTGEYSPTGSFSTIVSGISADGGICSSAFTFVDYTTLPSTHTQTTETVATAAKWYAYVLAFFNMKLFPILEETGNILSEFTEDSFTMPSNDSDGEAMTQKITEAATKITELISDYSLYVNGQSYATPAIFEGSGKKADVLSTISDITISTDKTDKINKGLTSIVQLLSVPSTAGISLGSAYLSDCNTVTDSQSMLSGGMRYYYKNDSAAQSIEIMSGDGDDIEVDEASISIPLNYVMTPAEKTKVIGTATDVGNIFITGSSFEGTDLTAAGQGINILDIRNAILGSMTDERATESMSTADRAQLVAVVQQLNGITQIISGKSFFVPVDNPNEYSTSDISEYMVNTRASLVSELALANAKLSYISDEATYVDKQGSIEYGKMNTLFKDVAAPNTDMTLTENIAKAMDLYNTYFDATDPLTDADVAGDMSDPTIYKQAMYLSFMIQVSKLIAPVLDEIAPLISTETTYHGNSSSFSSALADAYSSFSTNVADPYRHTIRDAMKVAIVYLYAIEMILAIGDRLLLEALFVNNEILLDSSLGGSYGSYFSISPKETYNLHIFHFMSKDGVPIYPIVETDGNGKYPQLDGYASFRDITSLCSYDGKKNRGLFYKITMDSPYHNEGEFTMNPVIFTGINENTGFWDCFTDPNVAETDYMLTIYNNKAYSPLSHIASGNTLSARPATELKPVRTLLGSDVGTDLTARFDQAALKTNTMSDLWNEPTNKLTSPLLIDAKIEGKLNVSSMIGTSMRVHVRTKDITISITESFNTDQPSSKALPYLETDSASFKNKLPELFSGQLTSTLTSSGKQYTNALKTIHSEKMLAYLLWNSLDKPGITYNKSLLTLGTTSYTINSKIATRLPLPVYLSSGIWAGADSSFVLPMLGIISDNLKLGAETSEYLTKTIKTMYHSDPSAFFQLDTRNTENPKDFVIQHLSHALNYNQMLSTNRALYSGYRMLDTYEKSEKINSVLGSRKVRISTYNAATDTVGYSVNSLCIGVGGIFSPALKAYTKKDRKSQQSITASVGIFTETNESGFPLGSNVEKTIFSRDKDTGAIHGSFSIKAGHLISIGGIAEETIFCPGVYDKAAPSSSSFIPYNIYTTDTFAVGGSSDTILGRIYLNHLLSFCVLGALNLPTTSVAKLSETQYQVTDSTGIVADVIFDTDKVLRAENGESIGITLPRIVFPIPTISHSPVYHLFYSDFSGNEESVATQIGLFINNAATSGKFTSVKNEPGEYKALVLADIEGILNNLVTKAIAGTGSSAACYIESRIFAPKFSDGEGTPSAT